MIIFWIVVFSLIGVYYGFRTFFSVKQRNAYKSYLGKEIPRNRVGMLNDQVNNEPCVAYKIDNKIYYVCCLSCGYKLQDKKQLRFAIDPYSGKKVDKSKAFIALKPNAGDSVIYFESEQNLRNFLKEKNTLR